MEKKFYLKTFMGVTSGTLGGRDDGYPEQKMVLVNQEELSKDFGTKSKEVYFELRELSKDELEEIVLPTLERIKQEKVEKKKELISAQISKLQEELRNL